MLDLKSDLGLAAVLALADRSDVLIEGFRPGVAERLGIGPDVVLQRNPRLVYGRMTGWGQDGPYAGRPVTTSPTSRSAAPSRRLPGADGRPVPPLNLLGDFGAWRHAAGLRAGGGRAAGSAQRPGQVVDAAIVDGVASTTAMHQAMLASGLWAGASGTNLFDGGAPFYRCYRTSDDGWMAVGAIEPAFYAELLDGLGLDGRGPGRRAVGHRAVAASCPRCWPSGSRPAPALSGPTVFSDLDACVVPVLSAAEAARRPAPRRTTDVCRVARVARPRSSRQPPRASPRPPPQAGIPAVEPGRHTEEVLRGLGLVGDDPFGEGPVT